MIALESLADKHIEDAAKLFTEGYAIQRERIPCLPSKYTLPETITPLIEKTCGAHPGSAAISKGRLVGYLVGFTNISNFKGISKGVYVSEWGHSVARDSGCGQILQPMYTELASHWIGSGNCTHAITYFKSDIELRDVLFTSGFGLLVIDAIRNIDPSDLKANEDLASDITLRPANEHDRIELGRLDSDLRTYLSASPTFLFNEHDSNSAPGDEFVGPDRISAVAEHRGCIVACVQGLENKSDSCMMVRDSQTIGIDFGYTDPELRGSGIGGRLLEMILQWGKSKGKRGCAVDFESANVLARSFWLRFFQPVCHSAIRHVDPRVA